MINEHENVRPLYQKLSDQLNTLDQTYEVIFVDDGSTDTTFKELKALYEEHPGTIRVIRFRRNFGKTPALVAGFSRSRVKSFLPWMVIYRTTRKKFPFS